MMPLLAQAGVDPTVDVATRAYNSATEPGHLLLLVFMGAVGYFAAPFVLWLLFNSDRGKRMFGQAFSTAITAYFDNGGGVKMRTMMQEENEKQSKVHASMTARQIEDAIREHEIQEQANLEALLDNLRTEITGEYPIVPARPAPRPRLQATLHTRRRRRP